MQIDNYMINFAFLRGSILKQHSIPFKLYKSYKEKLY